MKRFILAAGVAALAISAPAVAKPGHGGGHGEKAAKAQQGGSNARAAKARGASSHQQSARKDRAPQRQASKRQAVRMAQGQERAKAHESKARHENKARGRDDARTKVANQDRRGDRARLAEIRTDRDRRVAARDVNRDRARLFDRERDRDVKRVRGFDDGRWIDRQFAGRGLIDGCPPGLAAKHNGCLPPGQAKKLIGQRLPSAFRSSKLPVSLRDYYRDNDDYYYRYGDGYLYRVNRQDNLVAALLPLFGGGLGLGTPFPAAYSGYGVPSYYQSFYPDSRDNYYRYANGYVYGIDRDSGLIEDIVPLMAGGYGVGQMLPAGYSAYNVPYQYRSYYPDSRDAYYRYAPGAIYQVDPRTNLVTSVASLLSPTGFAVGQPLPMGYSTYNVPYQYRSQYYDTPDAWYRYNNGYIYQVDPTTQLISAVIQAIV